MVSNNAGGPYNDAQMQHVRPEHDPKRWAELHCLDSDEEENEPFQTIILPKQG